MNEDKCGDCKSCVMPENTEHNKNGKCHRFPPLHVNADNFDYPEVDPKAVGCREFKK